MAKFNITVEIDCIDEDGNLDERITEEIISGVCNKVSANVATKIEKEATERFKGKIEQVDKTISERLNDMMNEFFDTPKDITDKWGDVVRKGVSIKQLLKEACENFMEQTVDNNGNISTNPYYTAQKRVDYIVKKVVGNDLESAIQKAVKEVTDNLKARINNEVKKQLGEKLADVIGLPDMINGKGE